LGHSVNNVSINKRTSWYWIAMHPVSELDEEWYVSVWMVQFSADWFIESNWINNARYPALDYGGWLYKRPSWWYVNAVKIWTTLLGITADKIDRITTTVWLYGANSFRSECLTVDCNRSWLFCTNSMSKAFNWLVIWYA
jgi:hypothetical protein